MPQAHQVGFVKLFVFWRDTFSPGPGGKKNRQKERRLMKGFNLATGGSGGSGGPDSNLQIKFSGT